MRERQERIKSLINPLKFCRISHRCPLGLATIHSQELASTRSLLNHLNRLSYPLRMRARCPAGIGPQRHGRPSRLFRAVFHQCQHCQMQLERTKVGRKAQGRSGVGVPYLLVRIHTGEAAAVGGLAALRCYLLNLFSRPVSCERSTIVGAGRRAAPSFIHTGWQSCRDWCWTTWFSRRIRCVSLLSCVGCDIVFGCLTLH